MTQTLYAADLFCGAGGSSSGLAQACGEAGVPLRLTAVNHWPTAVETHSANHPDADHHCVSLEGLEPSRAVGRRSLDLLLASPTCTHHSKARGGKPSEEQDRASGWHVIRWAEQLRPRVVLVENVCDWLSWGPLGTNGKPLKTRKGETFRAWSSALESLGYRVSWRILNAADHGGATTRERLFVAGTRGRQSFPWPEPTHERDPAPGLFGTRKRWRAAREIIDWGLKGKSIAARERPLAVNTLRRIAAGLMKYGGGAFAVNLKGTHPSQLPGTARDVGDPLGTITGGGENHAICEPFITSAGGTEGQGNPRRVSEPCRTITATNGQNMALVEPFILQMSQTGSNGRRQRPASRPLVTVTTADDLALVEPMLLGQQSGAVGRPVSEPAPTVATRGAIALIEPFLVAFYGEGSGKGGRSIGMPLDTVTTRDRFGLVTGSVVDILFRMLQPHELAAAMGFPRGYHFAGNREQIVRQVGNAVEVNTARALCASALSLFTGRAA